MEMEKRERQIESMKFFDRIFASFRAGKNRKTTIRQKLDFWRQLDLQSQVESADLAASFGRRWVALVASSVGAR